MSSTNLRCQEHACSGSKNRPGEDSSTVPLSVTAAIFSDLKNRIFSISSHFFRSEEPNISPQGQIAPIRGNYSTGLRKLIKDLLALQPDLRPTAFELVITVQELLQNQENVGGLVTSMSTSSTDQQRNGTISLVFQVRLSGSNIELKRLDVNRRIVQVGGCDRGRNTRKEFRHWYTEVEQKRNFFLVSFCISHNPRLVTQDSLLNSHLDEQKQHSHTPSYRRWGRLLFRIRIQWCSWTRTTCHTSCTKSNQCEEVVEDRESLCRRSLQYLSESPRDGLFLWRSFYSLSWIML